MLRCTRGTRPGCMLSPFLFTLYIAEIVTMLEEESCKGVFLNESFPNVTSLLFPDDLVCCTDTVGRLQKMIDVLSRFCDRWGLSISHPKNGVMVFRNGGPLRQNENWFYKGKAVQTVSCYKYLGIMFTPKLVWTLCQSTLAQQARKGLYLLKKYSFALQWITINSSV